MLRTIRACPGGSAFLMVVCIATGLLGFAFSSPVLVVLLMATREPAPMEEVIPVGDAPTYAASWATWNTPRMSR